MRKKSVAAGLLLLGLALAWVLLPPSPIQVKFLEPRPGPVVVIGDSLTAGVGAGTGEGYVALLEKRLGVKLVNKGVSGDTTADVLARLNRDVLAQNPALVVLEIGGNDFLQKLEPERIFANLDTMVDRLQSHHIPVLLLGVQSGPLRDRYQGEYRRLAQSKGLGYVQNFVADVAADQSLKSDPIHPNAAGYVKLADRVEPELRRLLIGVGKLKP